MLAALLCGAAFPFAYWKIGPNWVPPDPGTLLVWWDASQLTYSNNQAIDGTHQVNDATGGNIPLNGLTGTVLFQTNIQNGKPALNFDGASSLANLFHSATNAYPMTIWAVVSVTDTSDYRTIVGSTAGTNSIRATVQQTTGFMYAHNNVVACGVGNVAVTTTTFHSVIYILTSSTYDYYIDGVAAGSGVNSAVITTPGTTTTMGTASDSGNVNPFKGYICEAGVYTSALGSSDRSNLVTYLRLKWNLP